MESSEPHKANENVVLIIGTKKADPQPLGRPPPTEYIKSLQEIKRMNPKGK